MSKLRVTVVNHASIEIACPPAEVWAMLVEDFAQGQGFARAGYRIDPIADPASPLGGYRMHFESPDRVDDRICRITERDDAAMRLSLRAEFLSPIANGMITYATYQAVPSDHGTLYRLDCHSALDHAVEEGASRAEIANSVAALRDQFDAGLATGFATLKTRMESVKSDS